MWDQRVQTCSVALSLSSMNVRSSISTQRNEVVPAAVVRWSDCSLVPVEADGGVERPALEPELCVVVEVEADGTDAETGGRWEFIILQMNR